ncbi:MAG: hypothetical protein QOI38_3005 [Sphingomonadales bacterium]|jgi:uncharacterized membrane protein YjgN (DUF898 family)|nr:hypothetical protein [Sphingomonadales bacterium]
MDATTTRPAEGAQDRGRAFAFTGTWQEFLPIALTNLLLTIVTLGIYRFWAKARERQYFWSRTRLVDDHLEWTGTGKEMFLGFLMVFAALIPIVLLLVFAARLVTEGNDLGKAVGIALFLLIYCGFFYMAGVAALRALRYRLSRTYWHGIRGGSDDGGWGYGVQYMWRTWLTALAFFVPLPWAQTRLWNARFNKMSFGQHRFHADATAEGLFKRWLLLYAVIGVFVAVFVLIALAMPKAGAQPDMNDIMNFGMGMVIAVLVLYIGLPIAALAYYAAYYRRVAGATSIAGLRFRFTAGTADWLLLFLGHIGLVIATLGFGLLFISYRNYSFAVRHLDLEGEIDVAALAQSSTRAPTDAEGLADAFDIGAI